MSFYYTPVAVHWYCMALYQIHLFSLNLISLLVILGFMWSKYFVLCAEMTCSQEDCGLQGCVRAHPDAIRVAEWLTCSINRTLKTQYGNRKKQMSKKNSLKITFQMYANCLINWPHLCMQISFAFPCVNWLFFTVLQNNIPRLIKPFQAIG